MGRSDTQLLLRIWTILGVIFVIKQIYSCLSFHIWKKYNFSARTECSGFEILHFLLTCVRILKYHLNIEENFWMKMFGCWIKQQNGRIYWENLHYIWAENGYKKRCPGSAKLFLKGDLPVFVWKNKEKEEKYQQTKWS